MMTQSENESRLAKALDEAREAGMSSLEVARAILLAMADGHGMIRADEQWAHGDESSAEQVCKRLAE